MCALKIAIFSIVAGLAVGLHIPESNNRPACAQIDFNDPTKITYWSPFGGIGPVVGRGIDPVEAQNMLSAALDNLVAIDEHQYKIVEIDTAFKCILASDMYEFHATLIDIDSQSKSCVVQIYENHQQSPDESVTAVAISCPEEPQYVKTYSEVQN